MKPEHIVLPVHFNKFNSQLLPFLKDTIFHVTKHESYQRIIESGFISPYSETFDPPYHFAKGYGTLNQAVCLLDFRKKSKKIIQESASCFHPIGSKLGNNVAIFIFNEKLDDC